MTIIYVDTEFNGFNGELISMALVTDDDREWYEVLPLPSKVDPWVEKNVVPVLGKPAISRAEFYFSLKAFLQSIKNPAVIADWYADLAHFFASFAGEAHQYSFTYPCSARLVDMDRITSDIPHNALSDARALRDFRLNRLTN